MRRMAISGLVIMAVLIATIEGAGGPGGGTPTATPTATATATAAPCTGAAVTTATFASRVSGSTAGDVLCLNTGSYGTFSGTNKAITVRAGSGQAPEMDFDFTTGDSDFTLDGMVNMYGDIGGTAHDITIKNSYFTGRLLITGLEDANILLDHNDHTRLPPITGDPALIHLAYCCPDNPSGVTVQNSLFHDTDADGIQAGAGITILNNEFVRILEDGPNHTDSIQLIYAIGSIVRGNWIHDVADGIVAFDGLDHTLIENNVVDPVNGRWGIEVYSDNGSIIRHNTIVPRASCTAKGCGLINVSHKPADDVTAGLSVYNNLTTGVVIDSGDGPGTIRDDHNVTSTGATYVGGTSPTSWAGYCLSPLSPVGVGGADDGSNAGITC